jgi:hypothetical protein
MLVVGGSSDIRLQKARRELQRSRERDAKSYQSELSLRNDLGWY